MVFETGIFASQAIWLWRVRHIRSAAKKAGMKYDEYVSQHPSIKLPRCESSETFVDVETGPDSNTREKAKTTENTSTAVIIEDKATETAGVTEQLPQLPPAAVTKTSWSG
jgi:hypothetical protein